MLLFSQAMPAQQPPPAIQWQKSLGGSNDDEAYSIAPTSDGGYIVAGWSESTDGDVTGHHGSSNYSDYWIVKLTSTREIEWRKSLGGSRDDEANSIAQTGDGGYIVAGYTYSNDGDVTGHHGASDSWVVKISSSGLIEWQQTLGGSGHERAIAIEQTADSGYIVAGYSSSTDGDVTKHHGEFDYWIMKLKSTGQVDWQTSLGGNGNDVATSIKQTTDSGYIVAGWSASTNGDITDHHGGHDYWVVKLTSTGVIEWQKSLGGSGDDYAASIQQTADGGYIVAGTSASTDGDVTGRHGASSFPDYWIVKLASTGGVEWQKSLGGKRYDGATSIKQTTGGEYILAGLSASTDGDITGNHGGSDCWIVRLTSTGKTVWQVSLGGSGDDWVNSIEQVSDGEYIIAGGSKSTDGDVTGNHGDTDYWIVKLGYGTSDVPLQAEPTAGLASISVVPNPAWSSAVLGIGSNAEGEYTIELISPLGEVVRRESVHLGIGQQEVRLQDIEQLPAGSYEVLIQHGNRPYASGRLVLLGR
ncbi:MAG: T9SS C-terminal target domain-containing protein [Armatimonadetes bacterium]|nr:T9SS C-terminal target domain-containing protein [Armatimonadota bacterium]